VVGSAFDADPGSKAVPLHNLNPANASVSVNFQNWFNKIKDRGITGERTQLRLAEIQIEKPDLDLLVSTFGGETRLDVHPPNVSQQVAGVKIRSPSSLLPHKQCD
jgi:hypothetical protein